MAADGGLGSAAGTSGGGAQDAATLHLLRKMDHLVQLHHRLGRKKTMREEVRSLEFWRAIIAECLASFFYVFLMCGCSVPWNGRAAVAELSVLQVAFTCGFAMCTLVVCFGHISGGHVNPALTFALFVTRKVTPLRAFLYVTAQCGGAIAGAALLYGVTVPGSQGTLGTMSINASLSPWQGFGVEFVLTFIVVFTVFATLDPQYSPLLTSPSPLIGSAYLVCSLAALPSTGAALNPARALGPAFVMNKWTSHWVYWFGPMSGGLLAGLIYEYIFDSKKSSKGFREALEELNRADSSLHSQDDDYDDIDAKTSKFAGPPYAGHPYRSQHYDHYRPDHYRTTASLCRGPLPNNANYSSSHSVSNANYGPLPPTGGGGHYGAPHDGGIPSSAASESPYGTQPYRPHSTASSAYATIHGNRPGGTAARMPQRLEYGPGSTKF